MTISPPMKHSMKRHWLFNGVFAASAFLILQGVPPMASAGDLTIPLELAELNFIGIGIGSYADYFGSDDYSFGGMPSAKIMLDGERYANLMGNDLRVNVLNDRNWRLGPEVLYRFGRRDVDDAVVNKMQDIDDAVELGLFAGYTWKDRQDLRKQAGSSTWVLWDVSSVHDGWVGGVNVYGMYPLAQPVTITAGGGFTYASDNYTETYFGVTRADSLVSGLSTYTTGGDMRDVRCWIAGVFSLSQSWHTGAGVLYSRLLGDGSDSPIVTERGSENQWIYGIAVIYAW